MLKMSYREKVVALVLIVLVIVLIAVMGPIKSLRASIKNHEAEQKTITVTYDEKKAIIDEIPDIEQNIKDLYDQSKDLNKDFAVHRENFQIDQYIQQILNKDNDYKAAGKNTFEIIDSFTQENAGDGNVEFYFYKPSVITYPILENADINGTLTKTRYPEQYAKIENALVMSNLSSQKVETHSATFSCKFTKDALFKFIDDMKKNDTGVRITNIEIKDYTFGAMNVRNGQENAQENRGYSEGKITFVFYTMESIDEPVLD